MNKTILIGRISTDLELREVGNEKSVCDFNLATKRYNGEADFIPVEVWGKQAENLVQYQTKGSLIAVEGNIRVDSYEDSEGNKRRSFKVVASNVQFLGNKQESKETIVEEQENSDDPFADFGESIEVEDTVDVDDDFLD